MARRELNADAALLSEIRGGREHVRWAVGGYEGVVAPLRDTICERLLDGRIGAVVHDATAHPAVRDLPAVRDGDIRGLHRRAVRRRRTRARTCCAASPTRRGRTWGRATCASSRAWSRACVRCSSGEPRLAIAAAALVAIGCGGGGNGAAATPDAAGGGERLRLGHRPPAADRLLRGPAVRHRAARRPRARVRRRAGRHDPDRARRPARSTSRSSTSATSSARAASAACCRWRSLPTTRSRGCSTSTTRTLTGTRAIVEYRRRSDDEADPDSARQVIRFPDFEPNHNGGLALFGPDELLYIGTGDGGGGGDQHGRIGHGQALNTLLGKILRIDPRRSGSRPYSVPAQQPVRRPLRRPAGDLQLRAAQPVAVLVRPPDRRPDDRRRRPERDRGGQLRPPRQGPRRELRLARVRGPRSLHVRRARARRGDAGDHREPRRRQLLDHRRRRDPRPGAVRLARALRVRRPVPRRAPDRGALDRPRAQPAGPQARSGTPVLVRRGRAGPRLRRRRSAARSTGWCSGDHAASARRTRGR